MGHTGTERDRLPVFRKQQAVGSNPTAGSPPNLDEFRVFCFLEHVVGVGSEGLDTNRDANPHMTLHGYRRTIEDDNNSCVGSPIPFVSVSPTPA